MREESFITGEVKYPDSVVFVYNPNYIRLARLYDIDTVMITFANPSYSTREIDINVSLINGSADVYISKFLQLLLFGSRSVTLYATITAGNYSKTVDMICIDGSLSIGERFGQIGSYVYDPDEKNFTRRVRWFKNFPFKVSVFSQSSSAKCYYRYDGNGYLGNVELNEGFNDVDVSAIVEDAERLAVLKIQPEEGYGSSTFDDTFDYTFKSLLESDSFVRLTVDNSKEGHYFRWVDSMGQLQYFLFIKGTEQIKVTDSNDYEEDIEIRGMYFGRIKRTLEKTRSRELKCCAVNLTDDEQEYVKTIISSVNVELYLDTINDSEIWIPVNVKEGSFSVSEKENLQDFEIVVELPISQTQTR